MTKRTWAVTGKRISYSFDAEEYLTYTEVVVAKSVSAANKARVQLERAGYTVEVC